MMEGIHILPLGAILFSVGVIWGGGIVVGSMRTRLDQHTDELKKIGDLREDITEVKRCIARIEGTLKVDCSERT